MPVYNGTTGPDTLTGSSTADTISGLDGNDSLSALGGLDILYGGNGNDTLVGGAGADTLDGGANIDTADYTSSIAGVTVVIGGVSTGGDAAGDTLIAIENVIGSGLDDSLTGDTGANSLSGGNGNDTLIGGAGADTLDGGAGTDTVSYAASAAGVTIVIGGAAGLGGDAAGDILTAIETVIGSGLADSLTGDASANSLQGDDGNDTLIGLGGADTLDGGANTDTVSYAASAAGVTITIGGAAGVGGDAAGDIVTSTVETIIGSGLADAITGDLNANSLFGGIGNDTLVGGDGNDTLIGGAGADSITGGIGTDTVDYSASAAGITVVIGGAAGVGGDAAGDILATVETIIGSGLADAITGDLNANNLFGGVGNDTVIGGAGADTLDGGAGTDTVSYAASAAGVTITIGGAAGTGGDAADDILTTFENIIGSGLDDLLGGDATANALYGGLGNDILLGGAGADTLDGGSGVDAVSYASSAAAVTIDLLLGTATGLDAVGDVFIGIEGAVGTSFADTLIGNVGDNLLIGGAEADELNGGDGTDTAGYGLATAAVSVDLSIGLGLAGEAYLDTLQNIENLSGSSFDDTLSGDALVNVLSGAGGADLLDAAEGNDLVFGGAGNDTLIGQSGTDMLDGGADNDTYVISIAGAVVTEAASSGTDVVQAALTYTLTDNVENLTLTGGADISGTGNTLNNVITGNSGIGGTLSEHGDNALSGLAGDDTIYGGGGNDTINGGTGNDSMVGGDGNDTFVVDAVTDVLAEALDEGNDHVRTTVAWTLGSNFENLTLLGTASINGTGNDLDNTLNGNIGANSLSGFAGNDALNGGDGNDTLNGGSGVDTLTGGIGDDLFVVDDDADRVVEALTSGYDRVESSITYTLASNVEMLTLTGNTGIGGRGNTLDNVLNGNEAGNLLEDGFGNDTLFGGGGNDTLDGGTGVDSLVGGIGDDTYVVDQILDVIVEDASAGTDLVQTIVAWTLGANLENLTLIGASGISGTGNTMANVLTGNARANLLMGLGDADTLFGGDGADTLDGGSGADSMVGGADNDTYIVDNSGDVILELFEGGTDTVMSLASYALTAEIENLTLTETANVNGTGSAVANVITGNGGNNLLSGLGDNDTLFGGAGLDTLDGGVGADSLNGGLGNDVYIVDDAGDLVVETSTGGVDRVESSIDHTLALYIENLVLTGSGTISGTGNTQANTITGNTAANLLSGGSGHDTMFGGGGDDTLDGGSGNDSMTGGTGNDTYIVDATSDIIVDVLDGGTDLVQSGVDWTLGANLENLLLTGISSIDGTGNGMANTLTGNTKSNKLFGMDGADSLFGGAGTDTLDGGTGADSLEGGADNDVYIIDDAGDVIFEIAGGGIDRVQTAASYTLGDEVENLTLTGLAVVNGTGTGASNVLTGNGVANLLSGLGGNDTLNGGDGADTLDGGSGIDSMVGGTGDDVFIVSDAGDRTSETSTGGIDRVDSSITLTLASYVENLTLTGSDAINGTGNTLANVVNGNSAANVLNGGSGNDTLFGGGGNDTLDGGSGSDSMSGGAGNDTYVVDLITDAMSELFGEGTDLVQSAASWTLDANFENLLLTGANGSSGTGNDLANLITGNSRANLLSGLDGIDTLIGGGGNDSLNGGAANDVLTGGDGADAFVFTNLTGGVDTVTDFNGLNGIARVGDTFRFEGMLSGSYIFNGASAFTASGNSQVRVDGGNVLVDTNGDGVGDMTIAVTGLTSALQLVASDFVFV